VGIGARLATALLVVAVPLAAPWTASSAPLGPAQDPAPPAPAEGDAGAAVGDAAIGDLVGCIQGSRRLAAVFLIDESQSLQVTDPENRRVDAARAALDGLTTLSEGSEGDRISVDVTFAAFANAYRPVRDWTGLKAANAERLERAISGFARRNEGVDTDVVTALAGARKALADRSATVTGRGEQAPCKAVFLFTDGAYDVTVRTAETIGRLGRTKPYAPGVALDTEAGVTRAEEAGRRELCREGGLADGLRGDDITLLTVALAGDLTADSQEFLTAVTAGEAGETTCGTPTGTPPGAYLGADDVDLLIGRFDEVAARVAGATSLPGSSQLRLCGEAPCEEGTRTVQVDASVRRLRIFALAPEPGVAVEVTGPAGTVRVTEAGDAELGPVRLRATAVAGRGLTLDVARPDDDGAWTGTWTVRVLDPTGERAGDPAILQIYVFSDLGVALADERALTRGEQGELQATVQAPESTDLEALLASSSAVVRLDDPLTGESRTVPLEGPPAGPFTATFTPPADYTSSSYDASVELRATTVDGGSIVARSAVQPLTVRRPDGSVQLAPDTLELPTLTGAGATSTDLLVVGGTSPGCVWFDAPAPVAPEAAGDLTVTVGGREAVDEGSCIEVPADEVVNLPVQVTPAGRATGAVRGVLEVRTKVEGGEANLTRVPYRLDLAVGIDEARRLALAALLMAGGLGLPLLLLLVINAVTARFQTLDAVRGAVLPVRVQGLELQRTDGPRPARLALRSSDFRSLEGSGGVRRFTLGGVQFRARASRNPFGSMAALAAPEGGAERLQGGAGRRVELDPGLAGSWIFLLDPDRTQRAGGGAAEGDLIAFLAEGETGAQLHRMQADIDERLPATAGDLAGLVRRKVTKDKASKRRPPAAPPAAAARSTDEPSGASAPGSPPVDDGANGAPPPGDGAPPTPPPAVGSPPVGFTGGAPRPADVPPSTGGD
jgi:hypothetical protein